MSIVITLLALLVEATLGYPQAVFAAIGHPVTWIGRLIGLLDRMLNSGSAASRRAAGFAAIVLIAAIPAAFAWAIQALCLLLPFGVVLVAIFASTLIAQRSLEEHVARVADALERDGLDGGSRA